MRLMGEQPSAMTAEPSFRAILSSPEYGELGEAERRKLLKVLQRMTPEERQQLVDRLSRKVQ